MSDLNTLTLQGRIARDAVIQTTKAGRQVALFTLAVNQTKKNEDGGYSEHANFFPVSVFVQSDKFASHLKKGQPLILEGRLKQVTKNLGQGADGKQKYDSRLYICTSKVHFVWTGKKDDVKAEPPEKIEPPENFDEDIILDAEEPCEDVFLGDDTGIY